jgi:hypothetical protein
MEVWRRRFAVLVLVLSAAAGDAAQQPSIEVGHLARAPEIDGRISLEEWDGAALVNAAFVQIEPEHGLPSPFRTVVRIAQTEQALYLAFEALDPEPSRLSVTATARDAGMNGDDSVAVMLDTFSDGRTAYVFRTNALATQWDARIADNGRTVDELWDAAWRCAASRSEDRWSAEFEIPFAILRFSPGSGGRWGINLLRTVPRRLETALWSGPAETPWRVTAFTTLAGLQLGSPRVDVLQLIPYLLAVTERGGDSELEAGADLRWRPSSALGIDLTLNPDFALIEADVETINLSRFELFIPEKRPFFLEGNESFDQRIRQFYSRRIGDISWGAKAIGTAGGTDYAAMVSSGDLTTADGFGSRRADYGVLRLQQGLPGGSTLGLLGAGRRADGTSQGSLGLDTALFFTDTFGLTAQLLRVDGPTAGGGLAWFVRPSYDSATTHFHVRFTELDRGIRDDFNAVGFLRDDDRLEWDTNFTQSFWFAASPLERLELGGNYNRYEGHDGVLRSWELDLQAEAVFRSGWELQLERLDEFKLFEEEFRNDRTVLSVGWDSRAGRSIGIVAGTGFNFGSELRLYGAEAEWSFGDNIRLEYSATRLELDPDPEGETTWIHIIDGTYNFHPDLFLTLSLQTNSAIDKLNVQVVWVWRIKPPFGAIQLAYQRGSSAIGEESAQGDTFFSKLSWVF